MKILYGVLDWGLGHATRSSPLIRALVDEGHEVYIVTNGRALRVLQEEFGDICKYIDSVPLYTPHITSRFWIGEYIASLPRQGYAFMKARQQIKKIIKDGNYDRIISDNRLDVYGEKSKSYFITHIVQFETYNAMQWIFNAAMRKGTSHYRYIIIPDFYGKHNLGGRLSNNISFLPKKKLKYIGIISRLHKKSCKKDIDFFIYMTGPEPQRTILQEKMLQQISSLHGKTVIAGGKPEESRQKRTGNITIYPYLDRIHQEDIMNRSKVIITRSGYTSIMDFAELEIQKAIIIPTPGQTEQEYLGIICEQRKQFHTIDQRHINLQNEITKLKEFDGVRPPWKTKTSVKKFLKIINA